MANGKTVGIYPGSFDPPTLGHIDLIERASRLVDHLVVGVLINSVKTPMFSLEERVEMLKGAVAHLPNVTVASYEGLLVSFARREGATMIFRGLRSTTDFTSERDMAQANKTLAPELETLFLMSDPSLSYISSSTVKELYRLGVKYSHMIPKSVATYIENRDPRKGDNR